MRSNKKRSVVGDPINFRGMLNGPSNEAGVVMLFGMVARDLGMYIQEIGTDFPDAIVRRDNGEFWEELTVEFEYYASNFHSHGHDPALCDIIVCWHNNLAPGAMDVEIIELAREIKRLPNNPICRAG